MAVEAFKLDELDPDAVRAGLQEYTAKLASLQVGLTMCICVLREQLCWLPECGLSECAGLFRGGSCAGPLAVSGILWLHMQHVDPCLLC